MDRDFSHIYNKCPEDESQSKIPDQHLDPSEFIPIQPQNKPTQISHLIPSPHIIPQAPTSSFPTFYQNNEAPNPFYDPNTRPTPFVPSHSQNPQYNVSPGTPHRSTQRDPIDLPSISTPTNMHDLHTMKSGNTISQPRKPELESPRKRTRRHSNDPDLELKKLAFQAASQPLGELAKKIKLHDNDDEKSQPSNLSRDRQKQIFAMVWLLGACETSPTAVIPRNRIYARYVQICADNALKPLTPASFGKLIRILFPNLTTRRLGVRGQSKYHYCGIKLIEETNSPSYDGPGTSPVSSNESTVKTETVNDKSQFTDNIRPKDTGEEDDKNEEVPSVLLKNLQSPSTVPESFTIDSRQHKHQKQSTQQSKIKQLSPNRQSSSSYQEIPEPLASEMGDLPQLTFIPNIFKKIDNSLSLNLHLPSIYLHLPSGTDFDIADTLHSLYRVHCTQIFSALRYMQTKNLFTAFSNFTGIVTTPVLKLWINPALNDWVNKCDMTTYRAMTMMVTKLHLQSVPLEVRARLREIAQNFIPQLVNSLQGKVPQQFLTMRIECARKFTRLLVRLLKVVETANLAAKVLSNSVERQYMLDDWNNLDLETIAKRELPCSPKDVSVAIQILEQEIGPLFNIASTAEDQDILEVFANFLAEIPIRFQVQPRFFLVSSQNLITACLREMSLSGGQGFGSWWVVRCWMDEFLRWLFELGDVLREELDDKPLGEVAEVPENESSTEVVDLLGGFDKDFSEVDFTAAENLLGRSEDYFNTQH